jgi:hypothetical protein
MFGGRGQSNAGTHLFFTGKEFCPALPRGYLVPRNNSAFRVRVLRFAEPAHLRPVK